MAYPWSEGPLKDEDPLVASLLRKGWNALLGEDAVESLKAEAFGPGSQELGPFRGPQGQPASTIPQTAWGGGISGEDRSARWRALQTPEFQKLPLPEKYIKFQQTARNSEYFNNLAREEQELMRNRALGVNSSFEIFKDQDFGRLPEPDQHEAFNNVFGETQTWKNLTDDERDRMRQKWVPAYAQGKKKLADDERRLEEALKAGRPLEPDLAAVQQAKAAREYHGPRFSQEQVAYLSAFGRNLDDDFNLHIPRPGKDELVVPGILFFAPGQELDQQIKTAKWAVQEIGDPDLTRWYDKFVVPQFELLRKTDPNAWDQDSISYGRKLAMALTQGVMDIAASGVALYGLAQQSHGMDKAAEKSVQLALQLQGLTGRGGYQPKSWTEYGPDELPQAWGAILEGTVRNLPNLLLMWATSGAVGAGIKAGEAVTGAAAKTALGRITNASMKAAQNSKYINYPGAMASGASLEIPSIYMDIYSQTGKLDPKKAIAFGTVAGVMEGIGAGTMMTSLLRSGVKSKTIGAALTKTAAAWEKIGASLGGEVTKNLATEGITEGLQTWTENLATEMAKDPDLKLNRDTALHVLAKTWEQVADATVIGAASGFGGGVAAEAITATDLAMHPERTMLKPAWWLPGVAEQVAAVQMAQGAGPPMMVRGAPTRQPAHAVAGQMIIEPEGGGPEMRVGGEPVLPAHLILGTIPEPGEAEATLQKTREEIEREELARRTQERLAAFEARQDPDTPERLRARMKGFVPEQRERVRQRSLELARQKRASFVERYGRDRLDDETKLRIAHLSRAQAVAEEEARRPLLYDYAGRPTVPQGEPPRVIEGRGLWTSPEEYSEYDLRNRRLRAGAAAQQLIADWEANSALPRVTDLSERHAAEAQATAADVLGKLASDTTLETGLRDLEALNSQYGQALSEYLGLYGERTNRVSANQVELDRLIDQISRTQPGSKRNAALQQQIDDLQEYDLIEGLQPSDEELAAQERLSFIEDAHAAIMQRLTPDLTPHLQTTLNAIAQGSLRWAAHVYQASGWELSAATAAQMAESPDVAGSFSEQSINEIVEEARQLAAETLRVTTQPRKLKNSEWRTLAANAKTVQEARALRREYMASPKRGAQGRYQQSILNEFDAKILELQRLAVEEQEEESVVEAEEAPEEAAAAVEEVVQPESEEAAEGVTPPPTTPKKKRARKPKEQPPTVDEVEEVVEEEQEEVAAGAGVTPAELAKWLDVINSVIAQNAFDYVETAVKNTWGDQIPKQISDALAAARKRVGAAAPVTPAPVTPEAATPAASEDQEMINAWLSRIRKTNWENFQYLEDAVNAAFANRDIPAQIEDALEQKRAAAAKLREQYEKTRAPERTPTTNAEVVAIDKEIQALREDARGDADFEYQKRYRERYTAAASQTQKEAYRRFLMAAQDKRQETMDLLLKRRAKAAAAGVPAVPAAPAEGVPAPAPTGPAEPPKGKAARRTVEKLEGAKTEDEATGIYTSYISRVKPENREAAVEQTYQRVANRLKYEARYGRVVKETQPYFAQFAEWIQEHLPWQHKKAPDTIPGTVAPSEEFLNTRIAELEKQLDAMMAKVKADLAAQLESHLLTPQQEADARAAFNDMTSPLWARYRELKAQRVKAGKLLSDALVEDGGAQLIGRTLGTDPAERYLQLAEFAQVLRDYRWEVFRLVFVDAEGRVLDTEALSYRLVGSAPVFPWIKGKKLRRVQRDTGLSREQIDKKAEQEHAERVKRKAQRIGATSIYMLHNHPTAALREGRNLFSVDDIHSALMANQQYYGDLLAGALVIDDRVGQWIPADAWKTVGLSEGFTKGSISDDQWRQLRGLARTYDITRRTERVEPRAREFPKQGLALEGIQVKPSVEWSGARALRTQEDRDLRAQQIAQLVSELQQASMADDIYWVVYVTYGRMPDNTVGWQTLHAVPVPRHLVSTETFPKGGIVRWNALADRIIGEKRGMGARGAILIGGKYTTPGNGLETTRTKMALQELLRLGIITDFYFLEDDMDPNKMFAFPIRMETQVGAAPREMREPDEQISAEEQEANRETFARMQEDIRAAESMVRESDFQEKFEGSVVVDEDGNPRVMFHGTNKEYRETVLSPAEAIDQLISPGREMSDLYAVGEGGQLQQRRRTIAAEKIIAQDAKPRPLRGEMGTHWGPVQIANSFAGVRWKHLSAVTSRARVFPAYLVIKNPLILTDRGSWFASEIIGQLEETYEGQEIGDSGITGNEARDAYQKFIQSLQGREELTSHELLVWKMQQFLKSLGFDGIQYVNRFEFVADPNDPTGSTHVIEVKNELDEETLTWAREELGLGELDTESLNTLSDDEFLELFPQAPTCYITFDEDQHIPATQVSYTFITKTPEARQRQAEREVPPEGKSVEEPTAGVREPEERFAIPKEDTYVSSEAGSFGPRLSLDFIDEWEADYREAAAEAHIPQDEIDRHVAGLRFAAEIVSVKPQLLPLHDPTAIGRKDIGPLRKNIEYGYSLDYDTNCPKNMQFDRYVQAINDQRGEALNGDEIQLLVQFMEENGLKAPCNYCYVHQARAAAQEQRVRYLTSLEDIQTFAETSKAAATVIARKVWGPDMSKLQRQLAIQWVKAVRAGETKINTDPRLLIDKAFADEQRQADPRLDEFLREMERSAQGAGKPKPRQAFFRYSGEILRMAQSIIDALNARAGLRMFSSTDFKMDHVIDIMEAITDAAVRKLQAHAFVKVIDFAKIFGGTGIKINIGLAAKTVDGEIVEDAVRGVSWDEAKQLRERYPDVGTIMVATNEAQLEWALNQPWIDMIIPWHRSNQPAWATPEGWRDFTHDQHDKGNGLGRNYQYSEHHNDVNRLRRIAKRDGAILRFHNVILPSGIRATEHENYFKLVTDIARWDTPQRAVTPEFDFDALEETAKRWQKEPVQPLDKKFINRFIKDQLPRLQELIAKGELRAAEQGRRSARYRRQVLAQKAFVETPPGPKRNDRWTVPLIVNQSLAEATVVKAARMTGPGGSVVFKADTGIQVAKLIDSHFNTVRMTKSGWVASDPKARPRRAPAIVREEIEEFGERPAPTGVSEDEEGFGRRKPKPYFPGTTPLQPRGAIPPAPPTPPSSPPPRRGPTAAAPTPPAGTTFRRGVDDLEPLKRLGADRTLLNRVMPGWTHTGPRGWVNPARTWLKEKVLEYANLYGHNIDRRLARILEKRSMDRDKARLMSREVQARLHNLIQEQKAKGFDEERVRRAIKDVTEGVMTPDELAYRLDVPMTDPVIQTLVDLHEQHLAWQELIAQHPGMDPDSQQNIRENLYYQTRTYQFWMLGDFFVPGRVEFEEALSYMRSELAAEIQQIMDRAGSLRGKRQPVDVAAFLETGDMGLLAGISQSRQDDLVSLRNHYNQLADMIDSVEEQPDGSYRAIENMAELNRITLGKLNFYLHQQERSPVRAAGMEISHFMQRRLGEIFRRLYAENVDPVMREAITVGVQQNILADLMALNAIFKEGKQAGWWSDHESEVFRHKLGDENDPQDRLRYGPMAGKYVPTGLYNALHPPIISALNQSPVGIPIRAWWTFLATMRALKLWWWKTIERNFITGLTGFSLQSGDMLYPEFWKPLTKGAKIAWKAAPVMNIGPNVTLKGGLRGGHKNADAIGAVADAAGRGYFTTSMNTMAHMVQALLERPWFTPKGVTAKWKHLVSEGMVNYSLIDFPTKHASYWSFLERHQKAWNEYRKRMLLERNKKEAERAKEMLDSKRLEQAAAEHVQNLYQNRYRVPKALDSLTATGFADYAAYPWDSVRTTGNALKWALKLAFKGDPYMPPDGKDIRPLLGWFASKLLMAGPLGGGNWLLGLAFGRTPTSWAWAGILEASEFLGEGAAELFAHLLGVDDDEEKEKKKIAKIELYDYDQYRALRNYLPRYDRNSPLIAWTVHYEDGTTKDKYAVIAGNTAWAVEDWVVGALQRYMEGGSFWKSLGASVVEQVGPGMAIESTWEMLTGQNIALSSKREGVIDVVTARLAGQPKEEEAKILKERLGKFLLESYTGQVGPIIQYGHEFKKEKELGQEPMPGSYMKAESAHDVMRKIIRMIRVYGIDDAEAEARLNYNMRPVLGAIAENKAMIGTEKREAGKLKVPAPEDIERSIRGRSRMLINMNKAHAMVEEFKRLPAGKKFTDVDLAVILVDAGSKAGWGEISKEHAMAIVKGNFESIPEWESTTRPGPGAVGDRIIVDYIDRNYGSMSGKWADLKKQLEEKNYQLSDAAKRDFQRWAMKKYKYWKELGRMPEGEESAEDEEW